jgi:hypothetical protein
MMYFRLILALSLITVLAACGDTDFSGTPNGISGPPVILEFKPDPAHTITPGEAATLVWDVEGSPTELMIEPDVGLVTGQKVTVQPSVTTTYTLTASNSIGSVEAEATVTVQVPQPTPEDPTEPEDLEAPFGDWAFEVTVSEGSAEGIVVRGVVSIERTFAYAGFEGVWGDVTACEGVTKVCEALAIGGIYRSEDPNVLKFGVGTADYTPLFVGIDSDDAVETKDDGTSVVEGEGEVILPLGDGGIESSAAIFEAHLSKP